MFGVTILFLAKGSDAIPDATPGQEILFGLLFVAGGLFYLLLSGMPFIQKKLQSKDGKPGPWRMRLRRWRYVGGPEFMVYLGIAFAVLGLVRLVL